MWKDLPLKNIMAVFWNLQDCYHSVKGRSVRLKRCGTSLQLKKVKCRADWGWPGMRGALGGCGRHLGWAWGGTKEFCQFSIRKNVLLRLQCGLHPAKSPGVACSPAWQCWEVWPSGKSWRHSPYELTNASCVSSCSRWTRSVMPRAGCFKPRLPSVLCIFHTRSLDLHFSTVLYRSQHKVLWWWKLCPEDKLTARLVKPNQNCFLTCSIQVTPTLNVPCQLAWDRPLPGAVGLFQRNFWLLQNISLSQLVLQGNGSQE